MSTCNAFIKKWFDGADNKLADIKRSKKWVTVKFTLTSNNSRGNVMYCTSKGTTPYLDSLLYYSRKLEGVNRVRSFTSILTGTPDSWFKPYPVINILRSDTYAGKREFPLDWWHPWELRQPFAFDTLYLDRLKKLFISIAHIGGDDILVTLKLSSTSPKARSGRKVSSTSHRPSTKFKFVGICTGEDMICGFSNGTAFLISFNGFEYTKQINEGQNWPGHSAGDDS